MTDIELYDLIAIVMMIDVESQDFIAAGGMIRAERNPGKLVI
jgi:hypothetical protein